MNTKVNLAGVELKNPVMTCSGTFGSGMEYAEFVDLSRLGAVVTKGVANVPWPGNPTPRVAEVYGGMLNAIGLQNPGIDVFCERDIPFLQKYDTKIIVNVCGRTTEDYCEVVDRLAEQPVDMLEINISCPNVKHGGIAFGQDPKAVEAITKAVKERAKQPIIMKLSPNVTDIAEMARAAEARRRGCDLPDQHHHRHEDRCEPAEIRAGQQDRRYVRPGSEAGGTAHGVPGGPGSQSACHRYGRHFHGGGRAGIHSGRCHSSVCGNGQFRRSAGDGEDHRRH